MDINKTIEDIEEISKYRLNICYKCPIYSSKFGGLCNNKIWLNPETGEVSLVSKIGFKRGCGCILNSKTKNINSSCPLNKW